MNYERDTAFQVKSQGPHENLRSSLKTNFVTSAVHPSPDYKIGLKYGVKNRCKKIAVGEGCGLFQVQDSPVTHQR